MATLTFTIDGQSVSCVEGKTVLEAADEAGIYIPRMCHHPDVPPSREVRWTEAVYQVETRLVGERPGTEAGDDAHCNLCLVEIEGQSKPVNSCITTVEDGMAIQLNTPAVTQRRKEALAKLLTDHPHACLTCAQKQGCSRTDCSTNVPVEERCCILLGHCELEKVADYIGIPGDTPRYVPRQRPATKADPLYERDYNLCIGCLRCVRICQKVQSTDILGAVWQEEGIRVGTLTGSQLLEAQCRFCGACVEICPTGALLDKEGVPAVRCDSPLPCIGNCPAAIDIPRYIRAIAEGRYRNALDIIQSRVPFPDILGYICFHPCEDQCRRKEIDQAVAICDLKRFVADTAFDDDSSRIQKRPSTGKKVAIIGSGPAGASAAYYLTILGHDVTVFDREEKPGGMLRYGIPSYRLPEHILNRQMDALDKIGVVFKMNYRFDGQQRFDDLRSQGFDSVLVATGVSASKALPIENAEADGIYPGLELLKAAKTSQKPLLGGEVVVIGGGNVAIDAAMTAIRLGAKTVDLVCLESREEMPAHDWEIAQAEEEGVKVHPGWGPKRFTAVDGCVTGVELKKCSSVFNERGIFDPQYDEGETKYVPARTVIVTIGQEVDAEFVAHVEGLSKGPGSTLKTDDHSALGLEGYFAAGDVVRGPSSVIDAIAEGRQAADAIDKYLGGHGLAQIDQDLSFPKPLATSAEQFQMARQVPETLTAEKRRSGFELIQQTLTEPAARAEAHRCLQCFLRQRITPVILPPERWQPLTAEVVESAPDIEGVIQLLNSEKKVIRIAGTANIRQSLLECLEEPGNAEWVMWEEDPMYTKRESELIQQYLQEHGELPGGGGDDDLDDLF
ncbi:MAG: FAD-dependent oxidoreductase [Candidatus Zixiibacteriota bacterium]|nr:MAG: FAD-dependent oxidoreductase [candidate division Zixibacteria bacterium]